MKRREFITKTTVGASAFSALSMYEILEHEAYAFSTSGGMGIEEGVDMVEHGKARNTMPAIRPEILNNPRAVFLIETHVDAQKDDSGHFTEAWPQLQSEGKRIAQLLFVKGAQKGGSTFIKPNFTFVPEHCYNRTTGVYSSPDFIVGMVNHLRDIGNTNIMTGQTASAAINHRLGRIYDAFDPANVPMIEAGYAMWTDYKKNEMNWRKTKNSLVWKEIPYFRPIGDPDNFLINIATLKCHLTGLTTLTVKNLQGAVPKGMGQFCTPVNGVESGMKREGIDMNKYFYKDYHQRVEASFVKHRNEGFKRWDHRGAYKRYEDKGGWAAYSKAMKDKNAIDEFNKDLGGLMQHEIWLQRGLDNAEAIKPAINIIEGVIGLDGEELNRDQIGDDQLVNIVIAGLSPFEVDSVGSYVMGHDPRELWYTRVAKERGFGECDPAKIDIYFIRDNGEIQKIKNLSEIKRHPLGLNWARKENPDERLFW